MTDVSFSLHPPFQFYDEAGRLHIFQAPELHRFLESLWRRTGGDDDTVTEIQIGELYETGIMDGRLAELIETVDDLEDEHIPDPRISELYDNKIAAFSVSSAHTTSGNELIIATAALTITLNDNPKDLEVVEVKSATTGTVTINGNGNTIDGASTITISHKYDAPNLRYSIDAGEWLIV